jgi:hypothetical protein
MKERERSLIELVLLKSKVDVMRCFHLIAFLLSAALASALPGILDNLGVILNDRPGQYIRGDPSKGDVRSPCPALNVLANLGYL